MRIFKKVLFVLFIVVFVLSLCMNVVLGTSSTLKLAFKDNMDTRVRMFYTASAHISNSNNITIINENKQSENQKVKEQITCSLDTKSNNYNCKMISKLYNNDSTLVRTSYFPGDGYKYSLEGETKKKIAFTNDNLSAYFTSLLQGAFFGLNYYVIDYTTPANKNLFSFDTDLDFSFNTFSFSKNAEINYKSTPTATKINLTFDKKDRLTNVTINKDAKLSLIYSKTQLVFPSFEGYTV